MTGNIIPQNTTIEPVRVSAWADIKRLKGGDLCMVGNNSQTEYFYSIVNEREFVSDGGLFFSRGGSGQEVIRYCLYGASGDTLQTKAMNTVRSEKDIRDACFASEHWKEISTRRDLPAMQKFRDRVDRRIGTQGIVADFHANPELHEMVSNWEYADAWLKRAGG